jgi:hypothetical protein
LPPHADPGDENDGVDEMIDDVGGDPARRLDGDAFGSVPRIGRLAPMALYIEG